MKTSTPKSLIPVYFDAESGAVHMLRFKEFYPRFRSFTHSSSCPNLQNEKVDKIKEQKKKLKAAFPELFLKGSNYKPTKIIGSGAYSVVCEAIDLRTNTVVAIKRIQQLFNNSKEAIRTLREIKLMHHLNDYSNIIHLRDVILPVTAAKFQNLLIVLDKMECDLANKIEKTGKLSLPLRRKIFRGIVNGLHLIHRANVLHRDLRPKNILLNYKPKQHSPAPPSLPSPSSSSSSTADMNQNMENKTENNDLMNEGDQKSNRCEENHVHDGEDINEVVICDFGMGRSAGLHLSLLEFTTATLYTPPEGLLGISDYGKAVDVWGIGCILAEMIIGHRLVTANSHREILKFVFQLVGIPTYQQIDDLLPLDDLNNSEAKSIIDELNSSFDMPSFSSFFYSNDEEIDEMEVDLLKKIFTFNPSNRITTSQLLDHPYFASLCKIDDLSNNSCPPFEYDDAELESLPTNQLQKIIFDRLSSLFPKEVSKTATM